jgi:hypothetical protein
MTDLSLTLLSGASAMIAMTIMCLAALRGWSQWIALKRHEMDRMPTAPAQHSDGPDIANAASRIDIADLRERVRKLEAIAAGVDL